MTELYEYIVSHTSRGECQCGACCDKQPDRPAPQHSVDVHFFWVSAINDPDKDTLRRLLEAHYPSIDRLKQGPSYIEIGAELGDQGLALRLIGLGSLVGLWGAVTPEALGIIGPTANEMAGNGMVIAGGFA